MPSPRGRLGWRGVGRHDWAQADAHVEVLALAILAAVAVFAGLRAANGRHDGAQVASKLLDSAVLLAAVLAAPFGPSKKEHAAIDRFVSADFAALFDKCTHWCGQVVQLCQRFPSGFRLQEKSTPEQAIPPFQRPIEDARKLSEQPLCKCKIFTTEEASCQYEQKEATGKSAARVDEFWQLVCQNQEPCRQLSVPVGAVFAWYGQVRLPR